MTDQLYVLSRVFLLVGSNIGSKEEYLENCF